MTPPRGDAARPVVVVSRFLPDPNGPASARLLHGFAVGARALGRDVRVLSWWPHPADPAPPSWVDWRPLPAEAWWRMKARALLRPRSDVAALHLELVADAVAVAEEPLSFAAVRRQPRSVLTVHYSPALDRRALGRPVSPGHLQDLRAERAATRGATVATTYSARVAQSLRRAAVTVPAAIEVPAEPVPVVDEPVVALVADWAWPPNRQALSALLAAWPAVCAEVPGARLLLAGPGEVGSAPGVRVLGRVPRSDEVLAQAAVVAFPVPPTSGPKVKVLEAAALGVPVVTTPAGVEGLDLDDGCAAIVADHRDAAALASTLVSLLRDPHRRAALAGAARAAVLRSHAPEPAARQRLAAIDAALADHCVGRRTQ